MTRKTAKQRNDVEPKSTVGRKRGPWLDEPDTDVLEGSADSREPSLQVYLKDIGRTPLLTAQEEVELAQRIEAGDEEARRRGTQKSILERKAPPTFGVMIELISRDEVAVYSNVTEAVEDRRRDGGDRLAPDRPAHRTLAERGAKQVAGLDAAGERGAGDFRR